MHDLTPLAEIFVPEPRGDEAYRIQLLGHEYEFKGLKALLGAADFSKAGDRGAGLAAAAMVAFTAFRRIGGYTGDVLGAVEQVFETVFFIAAAAVISGPG